MGFSKLPMNVIVAAAIVLGACAFCYANVDYEAHIKNLRAGTAKKDREASLQALNEAGLAAFAALVSHFSDSTPADKGFQEERVERGPDGRWTLHAPTLGDVCFGILQDQVEGSWAKGDRDYYVLTRRNAKEWLDARKQLTLTQLRRESRTESLRRAEAALSKKPSSDDLKETVKFLRESLDAIKD